MVEIRIYPKKQTPFPLGRHIEHDPLSRNFAYKSRLGVTTRNTITHADNAPILNQGNTEGCVGNACAQLMGTAFFAPVLVAMKHTLPWLTETEALNIYSLATHADGLGQDFYPPNDDGTSAVGGAKALQQLGYIDTYLHTFSFNDFLAAIQKQPVICGSDWTDAMFTPSSKGFVYPGPLNSDTVQGGHEYLCRGVNFQTNTLHFRNSWGTSWGGGPGIGLGEFQMTFADFSTLLDNSGDVVVPHGTGLAALKR